MSAFAEIRLIVPRELGSVILADQKLKQMIKDTPGVSVAPHITSDSGREEFRDPSTFLIAIAGTPVALAAVKGLFDIFKVMVEKAYETRQLKMKHDHEYKKLQLELGQRCIDLSLDQDQESVISVLVMEEKVILAQMDNA